MAIKAPSGLFCMKLTQHLEQNLEKMMTNVVWESGWYYPDCKAVLGSTLEKAIVTKLQFGKKK